MPRTRGTKRSRSSSPPSSAGTSTIQYWLMKSEPYKFSIDDLASMTRSPWDGVRNYEARNNMKAMALGDRILFYHSMAKGLTGVAGLAEVCREAYPDASALEKQGEYYDPRATEENNPWAMVDVKFVAKLPRLVTIDEMKEVEELADMALFKRRHLSVQRVTPAEYDRILALANTQRASKREKGSEKRRG